MIDISKFPYKEIRPAQLDVINRLNKIWDDPSVKYVVCELPTGFELLKI